MVPQLADLVTDLGKSPSHTVTITWGQTVSNEMKVT